MPGRRSSVLCRGPPRTQALDMDTPLHTPVLAALRVTLYGDLIVLAVGQVLDQALIWQARMGQAALGERLLALAAGSADEPAGALAPDLAFGRELTRRVLRGLAVAAPTQPGARQPRAGGAGEPAGRGARAGGSELPR
jgi:hypothetical protein